MYLKMNEYLRSLISYFENVLHPTTGWADKNNEKKKRKTKQLLSEQASPESINIRGAKKEDKNRFNPVP